MQLRKNFGYALVFAVFFLIVLSLVATVTAKLGSEQSDAAYFEHLNNKAYYAARAGLDWATYQVIVKQSGTACMGTNPKTDLPLDDSHFKDFSLTIACTQDNGTENVYTLTSTVTHSSWGDRDYVWKKMQRRLHVI